MKYLLTLLVLVTCFYEYSDAQDLSGQWEGYIAIQGNRLIIKTDFSRNDDDGYTGSIDIPRQGATDLPIQKVSLTGTDSVHFEFMAGPGSLAQFKGAFKNDSAISGSFHQSGVQFPFVLKRGEPESGSMKAQTNPPVAYNHEDLIIKNDSIDIGGTLTWPKDEQAKQLVIMISGSGAQDRDASMQPVSDFKPFPLLADSLTAGGIATFRYDDRGVGKSNGDFQNTSLDMLVSDVEAIINYFETVSDQSYSKIILLGHSQGGIVGGKVAAQNSSVDKLALMGSPGVTLADVVIKQVEILNKQQNLADSVIAKNIKLQKAIFDTLRGSQNFSQFINTLPKRELNYMKSPAYFSLLDYDPAQDLQKLNIPVLVLFGGNDTQVTVDMNKEPIEAALESADVPYQTEIFKDANHPFQKATTGQLQEYGSLKNQFTDGFTGTIIHWIKE